MKGKAEVTLGLAVVCLVAGLALGVVLLREGSTDTQGWMLVAITIGLGVISFVQVKFPPRGERMRQTSLAAEAIIARRRSDPTYGRETAIADLLRLGATLEALSLYREETGASLSEARAALEAMGRESGGKGGAGNGK